MTKNEAIQALKEGKKLTHTYMSKDEWVSSDPLGNTYTTEDGVNMPSYGFWDLRQHNDTWNEGWEEWEDINKKSEGDGPDYSNDVDTAENFPDNRVDSWLYPFLTNTNNPDNL